MLAAPTVRRPLSGAQAGIWYAQQLDLDNPMYNTGEYIDINGPVERSIFETALRQAVLEAEALHARFEEDRDGPWQVLEPNAEWTLHYMDLSKEEAAFEQAKAWMDADLRRPCRLTEDPLFTEALFKLSGERYLW